MRGRSVEVLRNSVVRDRGSSLDASNQSLLEENQILKEGEEAGGTSSLGSSSTKLHKGKNRPERRKNNTLSKIMASTSQSLSSIPNTITLNMLSSGVIKISEF